MHVKYVLFRLFPPHPPHPYFVIIKIIFSDYRIFGGVSNEQLHMQPFHAIIYTRRDAFAHPFSYPNVLSCIVECWKCDSLFLSSHSFSLGNCSTYMWAWEQRTKCSSEFFGESYCFTPSDHFESFQWIIDVIFYTFMLLHWCENVVPPYFLISFDSVVNVQQTNAHATQTVTLTHAHTCTIE